MGLAAGNGERFYVVFHRRWQPGYLLYAADCDGLALARQTLELSSISGVGTGKQADRVVFHSILYDYGISPLWLQRSCVAAHHRGQYWPCPEPAFYPLESTGLGSWHTGTGCGPHVPYGRWADQSQRDSPHPLLP